MIVNHQVDLRTRAGYRVRRPENLHRLAGVLLEDQGSSIALTQGWFDDASHAHDYVTSFDAVLEVTNPAGELCGALLVGPTFDIARHAFVSIFLAPAQRRTRAFGAIMLGLGAIFDLCDVHRLRFDVVVDERVPLLRLASRLPTEGVRRDWVYRDGQFFDCQMFSISRFEWETLGFARICGQILDSR